MGGSGQNVTWQPWRKVSRRFVSLALATPQSLVLPELAPERVRADAERARRFLAVTAHLLQHALDVAAFDFGQRERPVVLHIPGSRSGNPRRKGRPPAAPPRPRPHRPPFHCL